MINLENSDNFKSWDEWEQMKKAHYGTKTGFQMIGGIIDFDPDKQKDLVGGDKLTYDEYLDLQLITCESKEKARGSFALCYYYIPLEFDGQIEKITNRAICFKRIFVSGMYDDGMCFDGKEDHVWMPKEGFEDYKVGDCLTFFAEVYRYVKTGNGKRIDFALRNPQRIKKIDSYELPTDDELMLQSIDAIICETCYLNEHCSGYCFLSKQKKGRVSPFSDRHNTEFSDAQVEQITPKKE